MDQEQVTPILDDLVRLQSVDKKNMLRLINELPEQYETAFGLGRNFRMEPLETPPNIVFITGVGYAAQAADMAALVLADDTGVPVVSDHGGRIPNCIGEGSLVLLVDYLGKSQAALRNFKEAKQRGATVICITSGGKLLEAASREGAPCIKIPAGQPSRTAIGYLFVPLIAVIETLGLAAGVMEKISHAIRLMKNVRELIRFERPTEHNTAKQAAQALEGKVVVIYGLPGYSQLAAAHWKSQINANSKAAAFANTFPDVAESELPSWALADRQCDKVAFVLLRDPSDKTEAGEMMSESKKFLERFEVVEINAWGNTAVEKLLHGMYMADYASLYLALLYEVDPMPTQSMFIVESNPE